MAQKKALRTLVSVQQIDQIAIAAAAAAIAGKPEMASHISYAIAYHQNLPRSPKLRAVYTFNNSRALLF